MEKYINANVLEVYRITLLSNKVTPANAIRRVLEVYRITLLSNLGLLHKNKDLCFRGLQNYTTLKLDRLAFNIGTSFRGLQNYTTLKPR